MSSTGSRPGLRALIYNRVSSDPSGRRVSVESQDAENRTFCDLQGWDIVATIVDNDRSATRHAAKEREGYQQVRRALAGAGHGRIDVLVCWESSRAQRDLADYVVIRDLCAQHRVLFAYRGRVYDLTEGDDRFATGLDALVDEREAEKIRDRVLRGHRTSRAAGKPRGVVPYGYTRIYDPVGGHLLNQVPDPESAAIVEEIVDRILARDTTLYAIAQDLNRRGVLTPRGLRDRRANQPTDRPGWSSSMIRNLLAKQSLMGIRTYEGKAVGEGTWDPIVSPADWEAVQAVLHDPLRAKETPGREVKHLLSGVATCGVCGGWMRPLLNRGRMTYACAGVNSTGPKGHVVRDQAKLDAYVTAALIRRLQRPGGLGSLVVDDAGADRNTDLERQLADLEARLAQFEESAATGGMSPAAFGRFEARLTAEIEACRASIVRVSPLPEKVLRLAGADAERKWNALSLADQRFTIRVLMQVRVDRSTRRGVREFDPTSVRLWRSAADAV